MDHSSGGHMGSGFITGLGVPVWTTGLTPLTEPQYIGALFGLFLLSVGFRGLVAAQSYLEAYLQLRYHPDKPSFYSRHHNHHHHHRRQQQDPAHPQHNHHQLQDPPQQDVIQQDTFMVEKGAKGVTQQDPMHISVSPTSPTTPATLIAQGSGTSDNGLQSILDEKTNPSLGLTPIASSSAALSRQTTATQEVLSTTSDSQPKATLSSSSSSSTPPPFYNATLRKRQRKLADAALHGFSDHPTSASHNCQNQQCQQNQKTHRLTMASLPTVKPFVWQVEVSRALLTTVVVAVGYLLMLVIMTYHTGYIGTILAGVFVGDVFFGRWGRARAIPPALAAIQAKHESRVIQRQLQQEAAIHPHNNTGMAMGQTSLQHHQQERQRVQHSLTTLSTHSSLSSLALQDALRLAPGHHHDDMVC
ncbi:hypothetical protein BGW42_001572 [Actinomortierella wolfii]|nr:hypothetical protein BGW42_001572 [Actinomortierella wolfii]